MSLRLLSFPAWSGLQ